MKRIERWLAQPRLAFRVQIALAGWGVALWIVDGFARGWPFDDQAWLGIAGPILFAVLAFGALLGGSLVAEISVWILYFVVLAAILAPAGELGTSFRGTGERLDVVGWIRTLVGLALGGLTFLATHAQLRAMTGLGPRPSQEGPVASAESFTHDIPAP